MNAPDRSDSVALFIRQHPEHFASQAGRTADAVRRDALIPLCRFLNVQDGGQWGRLVKTDQHDFIPHDILIWRETKEHFDVFIGTFNAEDTRPSWKAHGPARDRWIWQSVDDALPPPLPPPEDPFELRGRVGALEVTASSQAVLIRELTVALGRLTDRLRLLEDAPPFELPDLVADGQTARMWGHGHPVRLAVRRVE